MNVLGFDTSLPYLTVALSTEKGEFNFVARSFVKHAANLLPTIDYALRHLHLEVSEVELLVVGVGPGSFTGIRVGVATAKGLMTGLGFPAVAVTSTELLAANVPDRTAAVCIPARKGHVYFAVYNNGKPVMEPKFVELGYVKTQLDAGRFKGYILVGEGWKEITSKNLPSSFDKPDGFRLLELGVEKFNRGEVIKAPGELLPFYVERPIAELKFASS